MSTPGGDSRLDDSVIEFIGRSLAAKPVYGWGWAEGDEGGTESTPVEVSPPFQFRLIEFFDWNQERRGGIGRIEQPGHIYDGYWLLFYTRLCGSFDFVRNISDYNFHIGRNQPSLHPPSKDPQMAEAWPLPNFPGCKTVWGYGQIGATFDAVERWEKERLKKWERERNA